jgi:hypothetical protein
MKEQVRLRERGGNAGSVSVTPPAAREAVLVSERHAVWTRPAVVEQKPVDELEAVRDPIWDHAEGTRWTPDLVHCRLLGMADTLCRLPGASRDRFRSLLAQIADPDPDAALTIRDAATPAEVTAMDWTLREVIKRPHETRQVLLGMAFEQGVRKIGRKVGISKSQVSRDYMSARRRLAAEWQEQGVEVDPMTFDRWRRLFENARK